MNAFWEMQCMETPCCSFAKTRWAIVDPILGSTTTLEEYDPGSWGPHEEDRLAIDVGGWHDPEGSKGDTVAAPAAA
jgi:hypothetical protein